MQERYSLGQREFCPFDVVRTGINSVVFGIGKIRLTQITVREHRLSQITAAEIRFLQIHLAKGRFLDGTFAQDELLEPGVHEGAIVQRTFLKVDAAKWPGPIRVRPVDAHRIAVMQFCADKHTRLDIDQAQIAGLKGAIREFATGKACLFEVTVDKLTFSELDIL